jgi:hypothetical protein
MPRKSANCCRVRLKAFYAACHVRRSLLRGLPREAKPFTWSLERPRRGVHTEFLKEKGVDVGLFRHAVFQ